MTIASAGPGELTTLSQETFRQRVESSPEWLARRRRAAWDAFESLPWPSSQRDEDWRRTDISGLHVERFRPLVDVDGGMAASMAQQWDSADPSAAFAMDAPNVGPAVTDADALLAQGVIITTLEEAVQLHPDLVERALSRVAVDESKFIALWNALWRGGVFIYVPRGVEALAPVWIAHPASGEERAVLPATVVLLDDASSLRVIDAYASPPGPGELFSDAMTMLNVGRDAHLEYVLLQQWGERVWHVATHRATLEANARLRFFGATLGSHLQKAYWEVLLDGAGAEADIAGVCFAESDQHIDHQSLQAHRARDTRSDLLLKVAVRDRARSVYSGLIDVEADAVHADGYVQNRNLLLSEGAKADSVPRLEIKANDVRCGHGATAGHIDEEQRFYFQSRAVSRADADALIVRGFLDDVIHRVAHPGLQRLIAGLFEAEVSGLPQLGLAETEE